MVSHYEPSRPPNLPAHRTFLPIEESYSGAMAQRPWLMRTYAGHSTAADSNALFHTNIAKGQTGLSIAFDLPTQTGYDPDS